MNFEELRFRRLDSGDISVVLSTYCTYLREFDYEVLEDEYRPFLIEMLEQPWIIGMGGFQHHKLIAFVFGNMSFSPLLRSKALDLFDVYVDKHLRGGDTVHMLLGNLYVHCRQLGIERIFGNAEPTTQNFFLRKGWRNSHQSLIIYDL